MAVVVLQHQPAGGRARHDVHLLRDRGQVPDILLAVAAGQVHVGIDHRGDAAALLIGDDDLDPIALENGDRPLPQAPVVVIDPAAVEVRHLPSWPPPPPPPPPPGGGVGVRGGVAAPAGGAPGPLVGAGRGGARRPAPPPAGGGGGRGGVGCGGGGG